MLAAWIGSLAADADATSRRDPTPDTEAPMPDPRPRPSTSHEQRERRHPTIPAERYGERLAGARREAAPRASTRC